MRFYSYILFIFLLVACNQSEVQLTVRECTPLPIARASATAFTLADKAYVCCGRTGQRDGYLNDLWQYSSDDNQWKQLNNVPFQARVKASAITVGDVAYIGMGFSGTIYNENSYHRDWWAFDGERWQQLADYPSKYSNGVILFNEGNYIYACFGFFDGFPREIYRYDITANEWQEEKYTVDFNTRVSMGAVGLTYNGRHFVGTGYNTHLSDVWSEFVPSENGKWIKRKKIPGKQRCLAAATTFEDGILVAGGRYWSGTADGVKLFSDIWFYQPDNDKWEMKGQLPIAIENLVAFTLQGKAYFGLGEDSENNCINNIYCLE